MTRRLTRIPALLVAYVACGILPSSAVLYGDEIYQDVPGGKFWAFYTEGVAVVDPERCAVETLITEDHKGEKLPNAWNDAVYMQSRDDKEGYVLVGSRDDEVDEMGDTISHMYALSTTGRKVISKAVVGPKVVHSYGVWPQGEFWMHSDGNGLWYVFDVDDLSKVNHDHDIEAKVETPAHGKLLWDEGAKLGNRGFGTTTREKYLLEFDLATKKQVAAYDYSVHEGIEGCRGTHAISYSELNMHVYAECSGGGGALEFDVSGGGIEFVGQFPEANGALYETPDGRFVVAASKGNNMLYVFVPRGSGIQSSVQYKVPMGGHPSTVSFHTKDDGDVVACSPMTENINQNQRRADGSMACDYYNECTGAESAADVEHGICLHDDSDPPQLVRILEGEAPTSLACQRCNDAANFESIAFDEGATSCTCTPHCGSCDPDPAYDDSASGFACVNLSAFVRETDAGGSPEGGVLVPGTGGMHQGMPYSSSPECGFGRTYRTHKRGMQYDAAVSNIPEHSLVFVDMEKMQKKCSVALPGSPRKVIYAPNRPVAVGAGQEFKSSAATARPASLAAAILGVVGLVALV